MIDNIFNTKLAKENWESKYKYGNESPIETFARAAKALASVEQTPEEWENKFFNTLVKVKDGVATGLKCTLGGRITANIGTEYNGATLLNCFINGPVQGANISYRRPIPGTSDAIEVNMVTEDTPDNLANIILTVLEQALTLKSEGGWGMNFDFIRPRASIIKSLGVQHPGVVKYMEIFDKISEIIVMGNNDGYIDKLKNYLPNTDSSTLNKISNKMQKLKKQARKGAMMGCLTCVSGDTMIHTIGGKFKIKELVGKRPYLYCSDGNGNIFIRQADKIFSNGVKKTIRVWMDDDSYLDCTPDHKIMLKNGSFKEAIDLKCGESLSAFHKRLYKQSHSKKGYLQIGITRSDTYKPEHQVIAEMKYGEIPEGMVVHHIDGDSHNNFPENIEILTKEEHSLCHRDEWLKNADINRPRIAEERRGKTWEEYYGPEKAAEMKKKRKKTELVTDRNAWNKGLSTEEYKDHYDDGFNNQFKKGENKTWQDAYGEDGANQAKVKKKKTLQENTKLKKSPLGNHKVIRIENLNKLEEVFDISMPDYHNFVANGIFIHNCSHPDIEEFIRAKQQPGVLTKFNISVVADDKLMEAVKNDDFYDLHFNGVVYKKVKARELYDLMMEATFNKAEPGVLFYDNMQKNNPISYLGPNNATNPCFSAGTMVLTREGHFPIEELVGKEVEIWDGVEWRLINNFRVTAENQEVYRLSLLNGQYVDATAYHKFILEDGTKKELRNISVGDRLMGHDLTVHGEHHEPGAYLKGFMTGDGSYDSSDNAPLLSLYEPKYMCQDRLIQSANQLSSLVLSGGGRFEASKEVYFSDQNKRKNMVGLVARREHLVKWATEYKRKLPKEIFNWSLESKINFIAGAMDADGSAMDTKNGFGYQICSISKKWLEDFQLLLKTIGVKSKLALMKKAETKDFGPDRGGVYQTQDCYRITISQSSSIILSEMVKFERLKSFADRNTKYKVKSKELVVDSIKELHIEKNVYCCTVDTTHSFALSNGLLVGQCGEVPGNPSLSTVCLLGSINLVQYINDDRTFDWDSYKEDVAVFARMLDNVNDLTYAPLPHYEWAAKNIRQYGMGINGFGSALYMMGIAYNSPEALDFCQQINWWKEEINWKTSALSAKEKGAFPAYTKEFLETNWFKTTTISEETKSLIRLYGARNAKTTTNPPLGNSSIICDMISNGIEPVFLYEYTRKYIADKWPVGLNTDNIKSLFKETKETETSVWFGEYNGVKYYYEPHNRGLCGLEEVRDYGYQWVIDNFPEDIGNNNYMKTTEDLSVDDHIAIQEIVQKNINQSVSKTLNLPNSYSFEDFKNLYMNAWERGLNGLTTYRSGTLESVISKSTPTTENTKPITKNVKLPETFVNGPGRTIKRENMKFYMHLSYHPNDTAMEYPIALWINTNHTGEAVAANAAARNLSKLLKENDIEDELINEQLDKIKGAPSHYKVGRMVSMCLRHRIMIVDIVSSLENIEGDYISSLLSAVRKFLKEQVKEGSVVSGKKCPECNSDKIVYESGCNKCLSCGNSNCG